MWVFCFFWATTSVAAANCVGGYSTTVLFFKFWPLLTLEDLVKVVGPFLSLHAGFYLCQTLLRMSDSIKGLLKDWGFWIFEKGGSTLYYWFPLFAFCFLHPVWNEECKKRKSLVSRFCFLFFATVRSEGCKKQKAKTWNFHVFAFCRSIRLYGSMGIRLHGFKVVDKFWCNCCALHYIVLEIEVFVWGGKTVKCDYEGC